MKEDPLDVAQDWLEEQLEKMFSRKPNTWQCFKCGKIMNVAQKEQHKC